MTALVETWFGFTPLTQWFLAGCAWWLTACVLAVPMARWISRGARGRP